MLKEKIRIIINADFPKKLDIITLQFDFIFRFQREHINLANSPLKIFCTIDTISAQNESYDLLWIS